TASEVVLLPCRDCKPPQNRGYSSNHGKSRLAWDCVVVEAASIEPVSGGKFPWAKTRQLSPCQRASWIGSSMHGSTSDVLGCGCPGLGGAISTDVKIRWK